jgi:hypothetical protein
MPVTFNPKPGQQIMPTGVEAVSPTTTRFALRSGRDKAIATAEAHRFHPA